MCVRSRFGFSLLEISAVLAIVGLLAATVGGLAGPVRVQVDEARARGELAVLAAALERYRTIYGDYPYTTGEAAADNHRLLRALTGETDHMGTTLPARVVGPCLLDLSALQLAQAEGGAFVPVAEWRPATRSDGSEHLAPLPRGVVVLDPFGSPYVYGYKRDPADATWQRHGYLLLSLGPSATAFAVIGAVEDPNLPASGLLPKDYRRGRLQVDNLFAHE